MDPMLPPLPACVLPDGITSRFVDDVGGLRMHVLEAGAPAPGRPLLLLLHGFPELAYSWRRVMAPLAQAGFHVIAPDQRGYGRTSGWLPPAGESIDFRIIDWVRDAVLLVRALGYERAHLVGHDFGSPVAAACALMRPDVFESVCLMSAPFGGVGWQPPARDDVHAALASMPRPRKHYQWYFSTDAAESDMLAAPQGLHAFLRAYYHHKSADWPANRPFALTAWSATELAKLPTYYVMDLHETMPQTVAHEMPSAEAIARCDWLPEHALRVYAEEFARTGFRGALQFYRCRTGGSHAHDLSPYVGRRIAVPACFIAGAADWGPYQKAGDLERMPTDAFSDWRGTHWIEDAGHWVQQERPAATVQALLGFLKHV